MPPPAIYQRQQHFAPAARAGLLPLILSLTLAFSLPTTAFAPVDGSGKSIHAGIVRDALAGTFTQANLDLIIKSLDEKEKSSTIEYSRPYDAAAIGRSAALVDRQQKKMLDYAADADSSVGSRYRCLKNLGILLAAAQDFYSRSNYLEVQCERLAAKVGANNIDPYNVELVDWNKLVEARKTGQTLMYGAATEAKEDPRSGKKDLGNTTYFKAARELAVKESLRQWQLLETLVKRRYRDRATLIITALKEASCPAIEPENEIDN